MSRAPRDQSSAPPASPPAPPAGSKDFAAWRASGQRAGASRSIGGAICAARDHVARVLLRLGATPNRLTFAGFFFTCAAGYCLARGASQQVPYYVVAPGPVGWWPLWAAICIVLAGACDMLDGALARIGNLGSRAGAILDSTVDRFSDIAIFLACAVHFAILDRPSVTYQVLAVVAMANALLISYIKARAENLIPDCSVGYWLRGERVAAVLIGCACGHIPAVLWQLAVSGGFSVWRRATYAYHAVHTLDAGGPPVVRGPVPGWRGRLQLWRHPRGSVPYDIVTGLHIAYIIVGPLLWPFLLGAAN